MTLRAPSAYNGFIPQLTGQMISYIRDPSKFKLNKYVQYIEAPQPVGVYMRIDRDQPNRIVADADHLWADGADRPTGDWNQIRFEEVDFRCKRRNYAWRLGNIAIRSAKDSWKPKEQSVGMVASQAMVNRTNRIWDLLDTSTNWAGNTDTANNLNNGAGRWDTASGQSGDPHFLAIKKALLKAALKVNLMTNAQVTPDDLVLVISPDAAMAMATTDEIHTYVKYGPFSREMLEGSNNKNALWGLPPALYGFELIVEDCPIVTSRPTAADTAHTTTSSRAYIKNATSACLMSRKGGINGNYGAPSFSTVQLYWYGWEMAVTQFDDPKNERVDGHVTDMFAEVLAAPLAGYLIEDIL